MDEILCLNMNKSKFTPFKNTYMRSAGTVSVKVTGTVLGSFARTIRSPLKHL